MDYRIGRAIGRVVEANIHFSKQFTNIRKEIADSNERMHVSFSNALSNHQKEMEGGNEERNKQTFREHKTSGRNWKPRANDG